MKVQYTAPSAGQIPERALADLSHKYGVPDQMAPSGLAFGAVWCVAGVSCAQGTGYGTRTVLRAKLANGSLEIILDEGRDSYDAWHAELLRAAGAAIGARGKASY